MVKVLLFDNTFYPNSPSTVAGQVPKFDYTNQTFNNVTFIKYLPKTGGKWLLRCKCGKEIVKYPTRYISGRYKSCGCLGQRIKDLTGLRCHQLTVIKAIRVNFKRLKWLCQCDCGNTKIVCSKNLKNKTVFSCGCLKDKKSLDIIGKTFTYLTVLRRIPNNTKNSTYECLCKCGKLIIVNRTTLVRKKKPSKSCGCYSIEIAKKRVGEKNPNYNPNLTETERNDSRRKRYPGLKNWIKNIKLKYNYQCQKCNQFSKKLHAHHIENWAKNPEKRLDLENGILFCQECHIKFHQCYGMNTNQIHLNEYLNVKS